MGGGGRNHKLLVGSNYNITGSTARIFMSQSLVQIANLQALLLIRAYLHISTACRGDNRIDTISKMGNLRGNVTCFMCIQAVKTVGKRPRSLTVTTVFQPKSKRRNDNPQENLGVYYNLSMKGLRWII